MWYVCFIAGILLIALSVYSAFNRRRGIERFAFSLAELAAATYVLYIPIFFNIYDAVTAIFSGIVNVLQVISLDADYAANYEYILEGTESAGFAKAYLGIMGLMHFLLPALSVLVVYNILMTCYSGIQLFFVSIKRRPLYVFTEVNPSALNLADDIKRNVKKCDIVFLNCTEEDGKRKSTDNIRGFIFHPSDLRKTVNGFKNKKDTYYFCISENEDGNMNDALFLIDKCGKQSKDVQLRSHIYLFSEKNNTEIIIDSSDKKFTDIKIVNRSESAVFKLLNDYPLYRYAADKKISVLLYGFNEANLNMLKTVSWCGILEDYELIVNVVGIGIKTRTEELFERCPDLKKDEFNIHVYDCDTVSETEEIIKKECSDVCYAVVDCGEDEDNIDAAIKLRRWIYSSDGEYIKNPPVFIKTLSAEKKNIVFGLCTPESKKERRIGYNFIPFGDIGSVDTYGNLIASELDYLAKNIHMEYEDIFSDNGIDTVSALERYNRFEVNKRSNRANAMHIRYKLALLGLDYTDDESCPEVNLEDYLSEDKIELLTVAEHRRWMAFLQSEGWTGATLDEVNKYKKSGISSGRHNCQILKKHPYICAYEDLKQMSDDLGLPDSRVYDRELIVRIPYILHDRWGISGKKYRITERKNAEVNNGQY